MYAARLWWLLRWLGHDSVARLDGGLQAWENAGQSLDKTVPPQTKGTFKAAAPLQVTLDAQAIERSIGTRDHLLIDARAADRYRGENETLDPIPSAGIFPAR